MFRGFSAVFLCFSRVFTGVERGKKSLVFGVVFLRFYLNTKEWKIRESLCFPTKARICKNQQISAKISVRPLGVFPFSAESIFQCMQCSMSCSATAVATAVTVIALTLLSLPFGASLLVHWEPEEGGLLCEWGVCDSALCLGNEKSALTFFLHKLFEHPQGSGTSRQISRDIPANFPGHPRFLSSKPKEDKLSRESTNFLATTPSCGRPPPPPGGLRT